MTVAPGLFRRFNKVEKVDPSPHALTTAERAAIEDRMASGSAPPFGLTRKLLRLVDQRRDIALEQQRRIDAALAILAEGNWSDWAVRATKALKGVER